MQATEEVAPLLEPGEGVKVDEDSFDSVNPSINDPISSDEVPEKVFEMPIEDSLPFWRLLLLTISFSGCIMCWSVEIANATPFLLEIGVPKTYVNYNWLIGPLSALFIQPVVGIISDKLFIPCIGRRKPWLFVGCFLCSVCLILFAWCDVIGGKWFKSNTASIVIGIVAFCVCDGSINTLHSAIKTLTIDVVPIHQQTQCNLFLSFFAGMGNAMGFFIGYIDFVNWFKMKFFGRNIRPVYLLTTLWLILTCAITFFSTWEKKDAAEEKKRLKKALAEKEAEEGLSSSVVPQADIRPEGVVQAPEGGLLRGQGEPEVVDQGYSGGIGLPGDDVGAVGYHEGAAVVDQPELVFDPNADVGVTTVVELPETETRWRRCVTCCRNFPDAIIRAYFVRFMIYFAKFWSFVYMSDYVGRQVFHGDPIGTKELIAKYEQGTRWASLCFCILSIFNMVNSPIINFLSGYIPIRVIWGVAQSTHFFGLSACYWIANKWVLIVVFYLLSFMETCCISFPYAILNASVKKSPDLRKYKGVAAGIFVSSQCFPEILVALLGGVLVKWLINDLHMYPGVMVSVGGLCAGIALILILFIKVPEGMIKKQALKDSCVCFPCRVVERCKKRKENSEEVPEESGQL